MELEENATVLENAGIFFEVGPRTLHSQRIATGDLQDMCNTMVLPSRSSSSPVNERKDSKLTTKDPSEPCTSQISGISVDASSRESMKQALKSEKAFIDFVMSLPSTEPAVKESPQLIKADRLSCIRPKYKSSFLATNNANTTKVGLDHLDNLCKLMEQLSELRDTNTKLQKRVQYLEDLKTLHEMHKEIRQEIQYGSENVLTQRHPFCLQKSLTSIDYAKDFSRSSKDYVRCSPRTSTGDCYKEHRATKSVRSPPGRRSRALVNPPYEGHRRERSKSVGHEEVYDSKSKRIFPKWSKVKEAFGWESERKNSAKTSKFYLDAGTGITARSGDSLLSNNRRLFNETDSTRLKFPYDYSEKDELACVHTYAGEAMAAAAEEAIPPFNSSTEDIAVLFEDYRESDYLKPKSLTIERDMDPEQAFAKFGKEESKKAHKSPWGRVKTIIERRRDSLKRRHLRRGPSENPDDIEYDLQFTSFDCHRKPSDDQLIPHSILMKNESGYLDEMDKMNKRKNTLHVTQNKDISKDKTRPVAVSLPSNSCESGDIRGPGNQDREVLFRTPDSSPQLQRKSTWMKMKNVLRNKKEGETTPILGSQSMPSSPNGVHDGTFDFEDTEDLEGNVEETDAFQRTREITRVGSDSHVHELSTPPPVTDIILKLQRNISDDFNRKLQEWERIRNTGIRTTTSPKWERKNSCSKSRKKTDKMKLERFDKSAKAKIKDLTWLEKELQKIEKEKERLSKEKEKYEERAVRLERLRQTVLTARNSNKKEVLVRTSAGEFRFEGISDAFTKKLYEWETKRGLGPEFSTIALLDSSLGTNNKNCLAIQQIDKCGNLQRALSRSESSIAEIGQPSHTSSNSLPSLKPPDIGDLEKIHHHSRANSEPELSSFVGISSSSTSCQNIFVQKNVGITDDSRGTLEGEARQSYVHPEVTRLIDSDVEEAFGEIESHRQEQREENYYSLLEENVILLEQLKNKEEICRRLEKELELLDEKVDEMNKHHQQEMEHYREKLWEMHKPGSTPREVQGCLTVMVQLRNRIENLEECSEKLKNEKETLEDSFRFHSAEQEHMTLDLLDKMRELHEAGADSKKRGSTKEYSQTNYSIKIVERLQDLSSQLVKQTQDLEQALAERTRQICQLRWELLHRDVSTVKLETELHSAQMQSTTSVTNRSACDSKRSQYAHFRSWSSEEASSRFQQLQECGQQSKRRPKANNLNEAYYNLPKTEFQASELSNTVHELNRELIRLSTAAETFHKSDENKQDDVEIQSNEKEPLARTSPDDALILRSEHTPGEVLSLVNRKNDVKNSKISVRRNSVGSISTTSGIDPAGSESSSFNDDNRNNTTTKSSPKLYRKVPAKASWTDSDSSSEEEDFTKVSFNSKPNEMVWEVKPDNLFKQSASRRKVHHEYDIDDKNVNHVNTQINPGLKKKNSYKLMKNSKKCHRSGDVNTSKQSSSTQSESDSAINFGIHSRDNYYLGNNSAKSNATSKNVNSSFYWTEQPTEEPILNAEMHSKPEMLSKKHVQRKDSASRFNKSNPVRTAASDSKIPKCNRASIRKSESCHEGKKSTNSSNICKDNFPRRFVDMSKTKQNNLKEKNNTDSKCALSQATPAKSIAQPLETRKYDTNCHFKDKRKETHIDCSIESRNQALQTQKCTEAKMTPPQISVRRKLFALQKEPNSSFENKTGETNLTDDSDEATEKTNYKVFKGKVKQPSESHESTFVLKFPKKKFKGSRPTDGSSSEQLNSNTSDRDSVQTTPGETVTIVLPRRSVTNIETPDMCRRNFTMEKKDWSSKSSKQDVFVTDSPSHHMQMQWCDEQTEKIKDESRSTHVHLNETLSLNRDNNESFESMKLNKSSNYINTKSNIPLITCEKHCQTQEMLESPNKKFVSKAVQQPGNKSLCEQETTSGEQKNLKCLKSPSAPQLDWKKGCAKKISSQGAPNVKTLIEKYNQKVLETQMPKSPCSSAYNSPAIPRKISAPQQRQEFHGKAVPFSSAPSTPKFLTASMFYNPLVFKPTDLNSFHSPTKSSPTSPSAKIRSLALLEAKEKFISSSNIRTASSDRLVHLKDGNDKVTENCRERKFIENNTPQRSATDSEINRKQKRNNAQGMSPWDEENNRSSIYSNKSSDSMMNTVLYKTGETCQESRLSKRFEKQKLPENHSMLPESSFKATKSSSNSSIFKSVTGYELKLPSSFLRLRRSRKKKDMSTVNELCRRSLLLSDEGSKFNAEDIVVKSPRSCPSSPELKCKNKTKTSWFQRNLFKLK